MDMDISYNNEIVKRCFRCDHSVLKNLHIVMSTSNNTVICWNEFQIFVYENLEFQNVAKTFILEFQIQDLLISNNYLVCLDYCGNIHTTSLKFKNAVQKNLKYTFQPREQSIVAFCLHDQDHTLCLKVDSGSYFLCVHKINTEFSLVKKVILMCNDNLPITQTKDKYIIKNQTLTENHLRNLKKVFTEEDINIRNNYNLVIISFNKHNVYGCLFSSKMIEEESMLVKLYSCPSEMCSLQLVTKSEGLHMVIGLTIGTLIRLSLENLCSPEIIHLNVAIHKFLVLKYDTVIYTDGKQLWKAENTMSKDIKFSQFFVKHVKDFMQCGDQIICTTFMNLIYTFPIDDDGSYLKLQSVDEYCSADKLLNNSQYLQKIMEEVKKNDTVIKRLSKEKNYITALSLSNRQDIMDSIISHKVIVYDNYEDVLAENTKVILTNDFADYFDMESFFFLIQINTTTEHKLNDILSDSLGDLRVHITLGTETKLLKTTSIKVTELLKKISFLIPVKYQIIDTTEMNVNIKIMLNIPGALDINQKIWTVLYRKNIKLHSEHFISFNLTPNKHNCLKKSQVPLEEQILQTTVHQYGNLFNFSDILKHKPMLKEWHMYVRLPDGYQELFRNKTLPSKKANYFLRQFTSEEFLKSKSDLLFIIGNEKVKIEIYNDSFSKPLLRILSSNIKIAHNIRNFLSDLIYYVFTNSGSDKEFVNLSLYSTVENQLKAIKKCITDSQEEIEPLIEHFERNVIGVLPV